MDTGNTGWILIASALVFLMTPGLGFFYGGLVRRKNVLATIMQSFIIVAVVSVVWVLWGYSLAFGPDVKGLVGDLSWFGLRNVGLEPGPYSDSIPHQAFMVFQLMFAIITPALITGAFAERAKFSTFLVFTVLWSTLVYSPVAHWVWGGGWLGQKGVLDFAGGTVVHINSGVAALAAAVIFGKRLGFKGSATNPHNVPFVVLGAALLWFGWFGFNAGSALAADGLSTNAFVVTNTAAATAAITWVGITWYSGKKPSVVGAAVGAVAGLVAITPAAGFVGAWSLADGYLNIFPAIFIGMGAGLFCYGAARVRELIRLDDSLDVVAVHGIGGTWGALATGIFATTLVGAGSGAIDGNYGQIVTQLIGIGATIGYSFTATFLILKVLDALFGVRVSTTEELEGLDATQDGEQAYVFSEGDTALPEAPQATASPKPIPIPGVAFSTLETEQK